MYPIAAPEHESYQWRANFLARMQSEMRQFLPDADSQ
jgi:hypothetical protein